MLTNTLNTNEVKNAAGTEVEFTRLGISDRATEFAQITETPVLKHRLKIQHQETGSGVNTVRRSVARIDKSVIGSNGLPCVCSDYWVKVIPVGNLPDYTAPKDTAAELMSFMASTGATTTILFDNSGNGANALLTGGL